MKYTWIAWSLTLLALIGCSTAQINTPRLYEGVARDSKDVAIISVLASDGTYRLFSIDGSERKGNIEVLPGSYDVKIACRKGPLDPMMWIDLPLTVEGSKTYDVKQLRLIKTKAAHTRGEAFISGMLQGANVGEKKLFVWAEERLSGSIISGYKPTEAIGNKYKVDFSKGFDCMEYVPFWG